jgi:hypothetical protein
MSRTFVTALGRSTDVNVQVWLCSADFSTSVQQQQHADIAVAASRPHHVVSHFVGEPVRGELLTLM